MPTSAYSQYQNPKTGEIIWLPQLHGFSDSIDLSAQEIENWVDRGVIPRDLYNSHLHEIQQLEVRIEKLKKGEPVSTSELFSNPFALTEFLLKNKARLYEENVLKKIFSKLTDNDPDIVWLSFVKEAISNITTSIDPLPFHFFSARKILLEKYKIDDPRAVDILARELLEHCRNIIQFNGFQHPAFNKNPIDCEDLNDHLKHEKKQMIQIDSEFVTYLKGIGYKEKELSEEVEKNCKELFTFYEDNNFSHVYRPKVWGLWVPDNDTVNAVLKLLCQALWEDKCCKRWYRETTGSPSLAKPIIERIIPILSPKKSKKFVEKDGNIILCDQGGEPLIMAPAVDVNMIAPFKNGVKELGTLTGHKMLRWQVNTGFEKWAEGHKDFRLIEIVGGYSGIAESIGCRHPREIAKIKDILHAQAHGFFKFADGSQGNMII